MPDYEKLKVLRIRIKSLAAMGFHDQLTCLTCDEYEYILNGVDPYSLNKGRHIKYLFRQITLNMSKEDLYRCVAYSRLGLDLPID
jgi:hypothetical protein